MEKITRRTFIKRGGMMAGMLASPVLLTQIGCKDEKTKRTSSPSNLTKLTMQAAWVNDAEFLGYFVAIEKKLYEKEGIDLTYLSGGPEVIPEASLLSGKADIALTTPDTTINLILKDKAPLKIIGTQYQKNPLGIVSLKESGIRKPADLIGKTLAVPPVNVLSVKALLRINNIKEGSVKIVPYQYDPTPLLKKQVDATVDFTTNVPYAIKLAGGEPESFLMYDFGFTIYNDTIVVTEKTLKNKKGELVGWLKASRKGWEENFRFIEKYPKKFMKTYFKGTGRTLANEIFFNKAQRSLIETPEGIFNMNAKGISANIRALRSIGLNAREEMFTTELLGKI